MTGVADWLAHIGENLRNFCFLARSLVLKEKQRERVMKTRNYFITLCIPYETSLASRAKILYNNIIITYVWTMTRSSSGKCLAQES